MSEPGITPLAQRLAEENNVDWRSLPGSGEGGRIVERDVLEYLARVMAGEEATDPTPEPLPDGLEAWPEQDGWAGDRIQNAGEPQDSGFLESETPDETDDFADWATDDSARDFGTPTEFDAEAAEIRATGEYSAESNRFLTAHDLAGDLLREEPQQDDDFELELSEDIFLLDDEELESDESPEPFLQAGDDDFHAPLDRQEPEPEEPLPLLDDFLDDDQFEDADLTELALEDGELDDPGLSDDSLREFEVGAFSESLEQRSEAAEPFTFGTAGDDSDAPVFNEDDSFLDSGSEGDRPDFQSQNFEKGDFEDDDFDIDFGKLEDEPQADDWPARETTDGQADSWQDAVEFAGDLSARDSEEADVLARRIEAAFDSVADSRPEFEDLEGDESLDEPAVTEDYSPEATEPEPPAEPVAVPAVSAEGPAALPLADFGNLLRRQLDVSQLSEAQALVGSEISGGESISALAFLLRGARRAAAETGLFAGSDSEIAAAVITDAGIELVTGAGNGFRSLAQQLQHVSDGGQAGDSARESLALAVADMSGLEVDEAILDLGVPMLSLGRILHDEGTGSFRSTLTLSGHFDIKEGARFLQVASELLANPLRLLL